MCSVLAAPMMKVILGLIHKWLDGQVSDDALTPDNQQGEVPWCSNDTKNSASAHREDHVQGKPNENDTQSALGVSVSLVPGTLC